MKLINLFLCLLTALASLEAAAEKEWAVAHYGIHDGLSYEVVRDIAMSKDQTTVWFATWGDGVCGLRGTRWIYLRKRNGLLSSNVRALLTVQNNGLWIGGSDSISYYDGTNIRNFTTGNSSGLPDHSVFSFRQMPDGDVWIGTSRGYILSTSGTEPLAGERKWQILLDQKISKGNAVREILIGRDGKVWAAISGVGIFHLEGDDWKLASDPELNNPGNYHALTQTSDGSLWTGVETMLTLINGSASGMSLDTKDAVNALCVGDTDNVWVGNGLGLWRYGQGELTEVRLTDEVDTLNVECLRRMPDNSLWVGTRLGAYCVTRTPWRQHSATNMGSRILPEYLIAHPDYPPISIDSRNRLVCYEDNEWKSKFKMPDHRGDRGAVTRVVGGTAWILNASSVTALKMDTLEVVGKAALPANVRPNSIHQTDAGELWMLAEEGVYRLQDGGFVPEPQDPAYRRGVSRCMEFAPDGSLWLGLNDHVEHWVNGRVENYSPDDDIFPGLPPLVSILRRSDNSLWFASPITGVIILKGSQWGEITPSEGLYSHRLSCIYEASDGVMWVGYRNGGISHKTHGVWSTFAYNDGIPAGVVLRIGESPRGQYWASIENKTILSYIPSRLAPETILDNVNIELNPGENEYVSFRGIAQGANSRPGELFFSWRLVSDKVKDSYVEWTPFSNTSHLMTPDLTAGKYTLQVRCADKHGNVDPTPATAAFNVLPELYRRPGFVIPVSILAGVILFLFINTLKRTWDLRESEARYRILVERASDIIAIIQGGRVRYTNPRMAEMLNYPIEEIIDSPIEKFTHESESARILEFHEKRIAGESPPDTYETLFVAKSGAIVEVEVRAVKIFYQGAPASLMLIYEIGERKRAQESRMRSISMEATATLAGGIAHDFNNLMMGVVGYSDLLRSEFANRPDILGMLEQILKSANRAADLARQLLAYARGGKYYLETIHLNRIIRDTLKTFARDIAPTIRIEQSLDEKLLPLRGDARQMIEIFSALLTNAIEALPNSKGIILVKTNNIQIHTERFPGDISLKAGMYVRLSVSDNGIGMTRDVLNKVFNPFFTTKFQGRGLGMSAVYGIVKNHQGEIFIQSNSGQGCLVEVYLPAMENSEQPPDNQRTFS